MHATQATPTTCLPSSKKFWYSMLVSNPLSHVQLFSLAFFCSALTQTVLMRIIGSMPPTNYILKVGREEGVIESTSSCPHPL